MALATHPGVITAQDSDLGIRANVYAIPLTEGQVIVDSDGIHIGTSAAQSDASGTIQGGLKNRIKTGVLWDVIVEPFDTSIAKYRLLSAVNLNTSGVDLKDLAGTIPHAISESDWVDIAAAIALGATNDTATASFVNNTASATLAALKAREIGLNVTKNGLVADGTTDDAAALRTLLTASVAAGIPVVVPANKTVALATLVSIPAGAKIRAEPGGGFKATASMTRMFDIAAANVTLEGVKLDANGLATSDVVRMTTGSDKATVRRCQVVGDAATTNGVAVAGTVTNFTITENDISGVLNAIRATNTSASHGIITFNRISSWRSRAIHMLSDASNSCDDILIQGNSITGLISGSASRFPIRAEGVKLHTNIRVIGNTVVGPGVLYDNTGNVGTADQISLTFVKGATIEGNILIGGGDGGISLSSCEGYVISGNYIESNQISGIYVGAASSATPATSITVTGNTILSPGAGTAVELAKTAIRVYNADSVLVSGNTLGNLAGSSACAHGVAVKLSNNVTVGPNNNAGVTGTFHYTDTGNTNLTFTTPMLAPVVLTSDSTAVNTSTTLVDSLLTRVLDMNAVYKLEAYIVYRATTTADLSLKFTGPTGATLVWTANGPGGTSSTSTSATSHRAAFAITDTATLGGVSATVSVVALPVGTLTTSTTAGSLVVQYAQATSEATDVKLMTGSRLTLTRIA